MKKLIIISILFLGVPFITYSQTPQLIWNKPIFFRDQTYSHGIDEMYFDRLGNVYFAGYDTLSSNIDVGVLAKYNNNFDTLWRKYDPGTRAYDPNAIYENKDKIIYFDIGYTVDSTYLVCRSISTGNLIWQRSMKAYSDGRYGICKYGDSLILGSKLNGSQVNLLILNLNGDTVRTFNVNIPINQGSIFLDYRDKFVWLKGSGAVSSLLSKVNLSTNSIVWTRYPGNFSAFPNCYLDTNCNYYFADSHMESGLKMRYQVIKYDSSGNTIWSKHWYPSPDSLVNINNWMNGVTVDESRNLMVVLGTTDKYNFNSSARRAYYCILNSINGDSIYTRIVIPNDTSFSNSVSGKFDPNGFLYIITKTFKSYGPYLFTMSKYSLVTTNIRLVNNEISNTYFLSQNYPNPFNPRTNIEFSVPKRSLIKINIYNEAGQLIQELINQTLNPGTYDTEFNGSNYSSGVYFYRLMSNDFNDTKKMVLIK
jgi:hypothetical protein